MTVVCTGAARHYHHMAGAGQRHLMVGRRTLLQWQTLQQPLQRQRQPATAGYARSLVSTLENGSSSTSSPTAAPAALPKQAPNDYYHHPHQSFVHSSKAVSLDVADRGALLSTPSSRDQNLHSLTGSAPLVSLQAHLGVRLSRPHLQQQQYRFFRITATCLDDSDENPMSPKEKKAALKAKLKAATAAAQAAKEEEERGGGKNNTEVDSTKDKKAIMKEKLAAKQAAAVEKEGTEEKTATVSTSTDAEPVPETTGAAKEETTQPKRVEPAASSASTDSTEATSNSNNSGHNEAPPIRTYSSEQLTIDAAKHKAGLKDPSVPTWQNPLHHNNPDMNKIFEEDFDTPEEFKAAQLAMPPIIGGSDGDGGNSVTALAPEYLREIANEIVHLNMLEMNELVNKIGDHFGFHTGMLMPDDDDDQGGSGAAGDEDDDEDGASAAAPAKTVFDIKLVSFDDSAKIKVIKEVRAIAGLGLKEAKELVEGAPKVVVKNIKQEEAEQIKAKLEELGATIEIV